MSDLYEVKVTRRKAAWDEAEKVLFTCAICNTGVKQGWRSMLKERDPICNSCIRRWGNRNPGHVWNRHNYQALGQLSAMVSCLQWEVKNGNDRWRYR